MKITLGREKNEQEELREQREKLQRQEAEVNRRLREMEDRSINTPVLNVTNKEPVNEPPVKKSNRPDNVSTEELKTLLEELFSKYGEAFPELGPSGHAEVERTLLLAICAEIKKLKE